MILTITIQFKDVKVNLTLQEAEQLYKDLHTLFYKPMMIPYKLDEIYKQTEPYIITCGSVS